MNKLLFIFLSIAIFGLGSCKDSNNKSSPNLTREISFTKNGELELLKIESDSIVHLNIEIADDDYKTQTGLMYRKSMEDNQAMLFVFPNAQNRAFYMKNTEIPLDILYFDNNKRLINFHENARPFDETSLPSKGPAKYVLEVNAGLLKSWGIKEGDQISFQEKIKKD